MSAISVKDTNDKIEGLDEVFTDIEETRYLKGMHELWLIQSINPRNPREIEGRITLHYPQKVIEFQESGKGNFEIVRVIRNYDKSREPHQKKYDRKVLWGYLKRWALKKYPGKTLPEIYETKVRFFLKQGVEYYYLAPINGLILGRPGLSETGLSQIRTKYMRCYSYPDELELNADKLGHVTISVLAEETIELDSYDEFLKEIGYEEKIAS